MTEALLLLAAVVFVVVALGWSLIHGADVADSRYCHQATPAAAAADHCPTR